MRSFVLRFFISRRLTKHFFLFFEAQLNFKLKFFKTFKKVIVMFRFSKVEFLYITGDSATVLIINLYYFLALNSLNHFKL